MKSSTIIPGIILATLSLAGVATAQSTDAVLVSSYGGVQSATALDVVRDPDARSTALGTRQLVPDDVGLTTLSDIKVLPDGSFLLADVGGRGVVVAAADGKSLTYVLDPMRRYTGADSASVASYFSPGQPSLILLGDSATSSLSIRSASTGDVAWFRVVRLATSSARIPQAIVLPQNRVAAAIYWVDVDVSAVEIHDIGDPDVAPIRFISAEHTDATASDFVVPQLEQVRDLVGLPNGNLLVTSRYDILELALDGSVVNDWSTGDFASVNGELASARLLPSGNIAFASFQPGEWVRPHTNHRVHWMDPASGELIATSEPLERAPSRVEPLRGSGGTGTFGFDGGLDDLQRGDPESLELEAFSVEPGEVRRNEKLSVRVTLTNQGEFPVALASLVARGSVGDCTGEFQDDYDFATASSVAIGPSQSYTLSADVAIDAQFSVGAWCMYIEGLDRSGVWRQYGSPIEFEIVAATAGSGSSVTVTPLPFGEDIVDDAGFDAGGDGGDVEVVIPKAGCCSQISAGHAAGQSLPLALPLIIVAAWSRRRAR